MSNIDIYQPNKNTNFINSEGLQQEVSAFIIKLQNNIWMLGIPSWLFGITDRIFASLADGYISAIELAQLFIASFFFVSWLSLKPEKSLSDGSQNAFRISERFLDIADFEQEDFWYELYLHKTQTRMAELKEQHLISQEYVLPFPYFCQIYHLLNLKHLENIHHFSLNNLRILKVSGVKATAIGGVIKFQTVLDSPLNALRIWRQPIVEVELILHSPYTVELSIPAYRGKKIIVMFNVLPIGQTEHTFFIDIYSDLQWFKPLLKVLMHFASCLTLFEDLPYLSKLAQEMCSVWLAQVEFQIMKPCGFLNDLLICTVLALSLLQALTVSKAA